MDVAFAFDLAGHPVTVVLERDDHLALYVDGCLRKRRPGAPCYLWTNVELPFEEHYLVEVRRSPSRALTVTLNGHAVAPGAILNPQRTPL
jgi:hypothetical protein